MTKENLGPDDMAKMVGAPHHTPDAAREALEAALLYMDTSDSPGGCDGTYEDCDHCDALRKVRDALATLTVSSNRPAGGAPAGCVLVPIKNLTALLSLLPPKPVTLPGGKFEYQDPNAAERLHEIREVVETMLAASAAAPASTDALCSFCPPIGYTDLMRCTPCPRRQDAPTKSAPHFKAAPNNAESEPSVMTVWGGADAAPGWMPIGDALDALASDGATKSAALVRKPLPSGEVDPSVMLGSSAADTAAAVLSDTLNYGVGISRDGERIAPKDFYEPAQDAEAIIRDGANYIEAVAAGLLSSDAPSPKEMVRRLRSILSALSADRTAGMGGHIKTDGEK